MYRFFRLNFARLTYFPHCRWNFGVYYTRIILQFANRAMDFFHSNWSRYRVVVINRRENRQLIRDDNYVIQPSTRLPDFRQIVRVIGNSTSHSGALFDENRSRITSRRFLMVDRSRFRDFRSFFRRMAEGGRGEGSDELQSDRETTRKGRTQFRQSLRSETRSSGYEGQPLRGWQGLVTFEFRAATLSAASPAKRTEYSWPFRAAMHREFHLVFSLISSAAREVSRLSNFFRPVVKTRIQLARIHTPRQPRLREAIFDSRSRERLDRCFVSTKCRGVYACQEYIWINFI